MNDTITQGAPGAITRSAPLLGRFFLSAIFITSGFGKIFDWNGTIAYMESAGMPMTAFFLAGAIVLELVGGFSVLLGFKAKWGALALIVFLVPASVIFHQFWTLEGMEQKIQMIMFMKNLSILGGLALIASLGTGGFSLDNKLAKKTKK